MWSASGTGSEAVLPGVIVPDSHVEFVFHLEETWRIRCVDQQEWTPQPSAFAFAQSHGELRFDADGATSIVAFRVTPVVTSVILGCPIHDIWNEPVALCELVRSDADNLCESLRGCASHERFSLLESWIDRRLANWSGEHFAVQRLFNRVMWSSPAGGVAALSRQLGWSDRGLRRMITQATGLSPKDGRAAGRTPPRRLRAFARAARDRYHRSRGTDWILRSRRIYAFVSSASGNDTVAVLC